MSKKERTDMWGKPYKKGRLDRHDAHYVEMPLVLRLCTYIKDRMDADVYINKKVDCTNLVKYMEKKKKENSDITYFHALSQACAKVVYNKPRLNRFIINHRCYERDNVSMAFVAKVNFGDDAKEVMSLVDIKPEDNIDDISKTIKKMVNDLRNAKQNSTDDSLEKLNKLPTPLLNIVGKLLLWLDKKDKLPASLNDSLIYNASMILSNLGSIHCGAIYHNISDFGSNSILITFGEIHDEPVAVNGKVEVRPVMEIGATLDERIADGAYMSKSVNLLEHILTHPDLLEDKASEEIQETSPFRYE